MSSNARRDRPLAWLFGEIRTPPFSAAARVEAGVLLRRLQRGESIGMLHSRPMPILGRGCHELRIPDAGRTWRVVYAIRPDAVVILEVFAKTTPRTPASVIEACQRRWRAYESLTEKVPR